MDNHRRFFDGLPEGCIANIISLTSPPDACRLSCVSPTFRSAADSNVVWERLLPSDCFSIISQSDDPFNLLSPTSKKELFFRLCNSPILINHETKSFWLDKWTGKKCYMLAAGDLEITWSSSSHHWSWGQLPYSRFKEVVELVYGWRMEISGKIDTSLLSPLTSYVAYLVFKWCKRAHGFDWHPTEVSIGISGSEMSTSNVCLAPDDNNISVSLMWHFRRILPSETRSSLLSLKRPSRRGDGWLEIELGEYFVHSGEEGELLEMSAAEWMAIKGGITVQGIEVRPKAAA